MLSHDSSGPFLAKIYIKLSFYGLYKSWRTTLSTISKKIDTQLSNNYFDEEKYLLDFLPFLGLIQDHLH